MFPKKLNLRFMPLLLLVLGHTITAQVTLTHNVGEIVASAPFACSPSKQARVFDLQDFGVAENEMFVINSLEIAYQIKLEEDFETFLHFYVYAIDDNFPASYPQAIPISRNFQVIQLETSPTSNGLTPVKMLKIDLDAPIHIPPNIKKILVEIEVSRNPFHLDIGLDIEEDIYPNRFYLASTQDETDASWVDSGDCPPHSYLTTDDYGYPNSHFYLKVFGNTETPPASCATPPISYREHGCDTDNDGFLEFDTSWFKDADRRFGFVVSYFDGQGNPIPAPFPDTYTNKTRHLEVITTRTFNTFAGTCEDVKFWFIVHDRPDAIKPTDLFACDEGNGFATFDASSIENQIIGAQTNVRVSYYDSNGDELPNFPAASYRNQEPYTQTITARVEKTSFPRCEKETTFDLIVQPRPKAGPVQDLIVPDDDGNGLGEFDTSNITSLVVNGQTGMDVSYFDALGSPLPSPLPNPFANTTPYHEVITVRVTNSSTGCFNETALNLRVSNTPIAMNPSDIYGCDEGNGYAHFDASSIETQIIGTQTGLDVAYLDANGQVLQDFPSVSYRNQNPYSQTVTVSITDPNDPTFHFETAFDLIVSPIPVAHALPNLIVRDDDGFAEFDTSEVEGVVVGNQTGMEVSYFDAQGSPLPYPLPNPYTNTVRQMETITVRVTDPLTNCYAETILNLQVLNIPSVGSPPDQYACDEGNGFGQFDVSSIQTQIIGSQTGLNVSYWDADGRELNNFPSNFYRNITPYSQTVTATVTDDSNPKFHAETTFNLIVSPLPVVHALPDLIVCDDDGIAEFDTSEVEGVVVGNQTGMEVSYFDAQGSLLPYPLPNPYTNTAPYMEMVMVRVTDPRTSCYVETPLTLRTSVSPSIPPLPNLFACDEGDGHGLFDTSGIETFIRGERSELQTVYLDTDGQVLPNFPSTSYKNQFPYSQTVTVRVYEAANSDCYSEASFDLVVIQPPALDLQETYYLCDLEPSRTITAAPDADSWTWVADDGTVRSTSPEVELSEEGTYTLFIGKVKNGINCESSTSFNLVRTAQTLIQQVVTGEDFSNDGHIQILASGDGHLEYSIDGERYQDDNIFYGLPGGIYTVYVRDRDGCGQDSREVVLLSYPRFFSPNNDGVNDYWQIEALRDFPDAVVHIYDRYGKFLGQIESEDIGWDGTFKGKPLPSSDYWFTLDLGDGREYKNHFTLKR
ncbi:T9SS type B sorting domain-containing protein [Ulvibacterium sp.]|uniref:T9SS type B sorting domain-containing protein n=1 Tax=Ulvibacterium sp. TaxID=2665914 RepID=UPI00262F0B31|nr:T9SS type B sorting domain-containing protein [Ulvibacterium sp.]